MRVVVLVLVLVLIVGIPLWVTARAPKRGLGDDRPRHPFNLPPELTTFVPTGVAGFNGNDPLAQEHLDVPPVDDSEQA